MTTKLGLWANVQNERLTPLPRWLYHSLEWLGVAVPDADTLLIDDPKLPAHTFDRGEPDTRPYERFDCLESLLRRPEYPDTWIRTGRIGSNVGEVEIERDQDSVFGEAGLKHCFIVSARQPFFRNAMGILAKLAQRFANELR